MAMDDRQQQIQVGAGLQESRLNTDLIAWLEKYGTWILGIVCLIVLSYVGLSRYEQWRVTKVDDAFAEYNAARGSMGTDGVLSGSPDSLLAVAREHAGNASVAQLATLDAAEIFLGCARRGLRPGADVRTTKPEDELTPEQQAQMLGQAMDLFSQAAAQTAGRPALGLLHLRALWGKAAVSTSKGELDQARTQLEEIKALASKFGFEEQSDEAVRRLEALAGFAQPVELLSDADLAAVPGLDAQQLEQSIQVDGGNVDVQRMPDGFAPPGFNPSGTGATPVIVPEAQPVAPAPAPSVPDQPKPQP